MANGPEGTGDRSTHRISAQDIYVPYMYKTLIHTGGHIYSVRSYLWVCLWCLILQVLYVQWKYIYVYFTAITSHPYFVHTLLSNTHMKWWNKNSCDVYCVVSYRGTLMCIDWEVRYVIGDRIEFISESFKGYIQFCFKQFV